MSFWGVSDAHLFIKLIYSWRGWGWRCVYAHFFCTCPLTAASLLVDINTLSSCLILIAFAVWIPSNVKVSISEVHIHINRVFLRKWQILEEKRQAVLSDANPNGRSYGINYCKSTLSAILFFFLYFRRKFHIFVFVYLVQWLDFFYQCI